MSILIRENFLHYLWKQKLFNLKDLKTSTGEKLEIIKTGMHNNDSGPDFFNAQLKIDGQLWAGNVEIHLKSSDWYAHNHQLDTAYDSVILHVVWNDDMPVYNKSNSIVTTLILKDYVDELIIKNYFDLFSSAKELLNCESEINKIDTFIFQNWKERLYFERLQSKSVFILQLLKESANDWEAVLFKMLSKNFGLKVNGESFLQMANSVDYKIVRKLRNDIFKLESLFFGQISLLNKPVENVYYQKLQKEYLYLQKKFLLNNKTVSGVKFFRLRPNNFPTIRLSQLASLYFNQDNLFSKLMETNNLDDIYRLFSVSATSFWDTHYTFEAKSKKRKKVITKSFIDLLLINTIIPLKLTYQQYLGNFNENEILNLINNIKPEKNSIVTMFYKLGVGTNNALDSQALIQLKNNYCNLNRCLDCVVGNSVMKNTNKVQEI